MAKKTTRKQVAINQWEKLLHREPIKIKLVADEADSPEIEVRYQLGLHEMWEVVDEMVEFCVPTINTGDEENEKIEQVYMPENMDFALRRVVVSRYGNMRLPDDYSKQYQLLYGTDVYKRIYDVVDKDQLHEIYTAVDCKVEYRKQYMLSLSKTVRELLEQFVGAAEKLGDIDTESIQKALKLMDDTNEIGKAAINQAMDEATQPKAKVEAEKQDNIVFLKQ